MVMRWFAETDYRSGRKVFSSPLLGHIQLHFGLVPRVLILIGQCVKLTSSHPASG